MHQQLAQIPLLARGHPEARETIREQQVQQVLGVARVGLLLANLAGPDLRRIAHPQLVPAFGQQPLEPQRRKRRFHPHHRAARPPGVEASRFPVFMLQPTGLDLPRLLLHPGHNLVARVQITADNVHGFGSFPANLGQDINLSLPALRSRRRYPIRLPLLQSAAFAMGVPTPPVAAIKAPFGAGGTG
jgi:hypothetical protein